MFTTACYCIHYVLSVIICSFASRSRVVGYYKEDSAEPRQGDSIAVGLLKIMHHRWNLWSLVPIVNVAIAVYTSFVAFYCVMTDYLPRTGSVSVRPDFISSITNKGD